MKRREFITAVMATALLAPLSGKAWAMGFLDSDKKTTGGSDAADKAFPFQLSEAEWRNRLTEQQFKVLRQHGTERAFSSPLNDEKRNGSFLCAGCGNLLFLSDHKFDSGTGWPSFWQPAGESSIGTSADRKLFVVRTEVHCANCGGHLGHVFNDGPPPTGLRYCMNGAALRFVPA